MGSEQHASLLIYSSPHPRVLAVVRRAAFPVALVMAMLGDWHLSTSLRYLDALDEKEGWLVRIDVKGISWRDGPGLRYTPTRPGHLANERRHS